MPYFARGMHQSLSCVGVRVQGIISMIRRDCPDLLHVRKSPRPPSPGEISRPIQRLSGGSTAHDYNGIGRSDERTYLHKQLLPSGVYCTLHAGSLARFARRGLQKLGGAGLSLLTSRILSWNRAPFAFPFHAVRQVAPPLRCLQDRKSPQAGPGLTPIRSILKTFPSIPMIRALQLRNFLTQLKHQRPCSVCGRPLLANAHPLTNLTSPDLLGSVAFTPVKSDMLGNVKVCLPPNRPTCSFS